ncbi:MAG: family N-acetyltransferase [Holophagaceae bacterium]|nr:family N-acetyltransferase [Holophagaceae bacterium]
MSPLLILRVHADLRLGLGHVARAIALQEAWRALGGEACIAVSGDDRARRVGGGTHPFLDQPLPCATHDLGTDLYAPLPADLKARGAVVLVDQWDTTAAFLQGLRPLKVAVMEDDTDAHESADLLFQPYLEGVRWPDHPVKVMDGRKVRPFETMSGACRVVRGSLFITVDKTALELRPKRMPLQPLAVHKLLVTFGGSDGPNLAQKAFDTLARLAAEDRWRGACTVLAPNGIQGDPFPGCTVVRGLPALTRRIPDFDAIWCSAGVTLAEALCMGVPAAVWGQNERQHTILSDLAMANGCFDLGVGPEADLAIVREALAQWLGPEGQDNRQEQVRDGMALVDGMAASRVAQELWRLAERPA